MLASLSKSQKKVARTLIDLALERECAKPIRKVSKLTSKPLDDVEKPNHARYIELFNAIDSFDRRLQNRYDGITGGHYLETISYLYAEGSLKEDDLEICDEQMKSEVKRVKAFLSKHQGNRIKILAWQASRSVLCSIPHILDVHRFDRTPFLGISCVQILSSFLR